jgi:hypothetical protein
MEDPVGAILYGCPKRGHQPTDFQTETQNGHIANQGNRPERSRIGDCPTRIIITVRSEQIHHPQKRVRK